MNLKKQNAAQLPSHGPPLDGPLGTHAASGGLAHSGTSGGPPRRFGAQVSSALAPHADKGLQMDGASCLICLRSGVWGSGSAGILGSHTTSLSLSFTHGDYSVLLILKIFMRTKCDFLSINMHVASYH